MFRLPEVTLVMIETREHALAHLAVLDCVQKIHFGEVLIFTDVPERFASLHTDVGAYILHDSNQSVRCIQVPDWSSKLGWCQFHMHGVAPYLRTSHALGIQWDSWVVDTHQWTDEFLRYDYVGGPWNYTDGMNVGDGGFELRSTVLLRYLRQNAARFPCTNDRDDELLCRKYRNVLQDEGFEWAPVSLATRFSHPVSRDLSQRMFGFHSLPSFWYGCGGNRERFLERVRLLTESSYITSARSAMWGDFLTQNPEAKEEWLKCTA
jgi:hypothetical protein